MEKSIKRVIKKAVSLLLILCLTFSICACGNKEDGLAKKEPISVVFTTGFSDDELFKIGTSVCTVDEFLVYLANTQNAYELVYGENLWADENDDKTMEIRLLENTVDQIAQIKVMSMLAAEYNVKLSGDEREKIAEAAEQYYNSLSKEEIEIFQVTEERIEAMYSEYALAQKVYSYIIRDINPEISDDEARNVTVDWIYLKKGEVVSGNDIQLSKARDYVNRINLGESFENIAISSSEDDVLTHSFGKEDVDVAIADVAFDMAEGEVSDIITTEDGYYILYCVSTLNREETDLNKIKIIERRKNEAFNEVYIKFATSQLRQVNDELWNQMGLIHDANVTTHTYFSVYEEYFLDEK